MMKLIKYLVGFVLTILLIVIFGIALLAVLVKPDYVKSLLNEQILASTGKNLEIRGDLSWTFWPHLGLKVSQTLFGSENNFGNLPFIQLDQFVIRIKPLPLFDKKIMVDELSVKNLVINFVKNKEKLMNWQTLKLTGQEKNSTSPKVHQNLDFQLTIPQISANHIQINWINLGHKAKNIFSAQNFKATIASNRNLININPIRANLYGGNFSANITTNINTKTVNSDASFHRINIQSLLTDFAQYSKISGIANLRSSITLHNFDFNQNSGTLTFDISNGVIKIVNVIQLVKMANELRQGKILAIRRAVDLGQTPFGTLTGKASIQNNLVTFQSIQFSSSDVSGSGTGTLDLNSFQVNIHISAWPKGRTDQPASIIIAGDIRNPKVSIDQASLVKTIVRQQEKNIKQLIGKNLKKINLSTIFR